MITHPASPATREERDSLGVFTVPAYALYGVQTARALDNFPISGFRAFPALVDAIVVVKKAAALTNRDLGRLDIRKADAIIHAADEILSGQHRDQFVVDVFQAGAGTSFNMNANEVLANRANELLHLERGDYKLGVHPNDDVNMAQSTNDVFPTAMRLAGLMLAKPLIEQIAACAAAFELKGEEFQDILKSGRTHLQDAVPIRLGQEFAAYGKALRRASAQVKAAADDLGEIGIGGTAVGTGLNAGPEYRAVVVRYLSELTGLPLLPAEDPIHLMQSQAAIGELSGALRGLALELIRIANDLRLLSSGPRTGIGEIILPPVQPGSSIMPGKVNPVMAEMLNMVCFQVVGCDAAIAYAVQAGQMELNVMMPVMAWNLLLAETILANALRVFTGKCVAGITADPAQATYFLDRSVGLATILNPKIGYSAAAEVAKESVASGRSIRELVLERGLLTQTEIDSLIGDTYQT
ncbi:MAG: aspartate ammonia-lyase [Armatimonadota bacterium]